MRMILTLAVSATLGFGGMLAADSGDKPLAATPPVPQTSQPAKEANMNYEKATFAAGCFWGVQAKFDATKGVASTVVGYTGGDTKDPTYKDVCTDGTGHAEAIEITFDPSVVSYEQLLEQFFSLHDPTQLNRQGPDVGSQYRSAIFVHSPAQEAAAKAAIKRLGDAKKFARPIVTQVVQASKFYAAEDYHQKYLAKRGRSSCGVGEKP